MSTSQSQIQTAKSAKVRVGDLLRDARLAKGLDLDDVAKELRIARSDLENLEAMYAPGIKRGYLNPILRSYARFLGLPAERLIELFAEQCGAVAQTTPARPEHVEPQRSTQALRAAAVGFVGALAVVALGFGAMTLTTGSTTDADQRADAAPVNGARTSLFDTVAFEALEPQLPLALIALEDSWLEVRGEDGTKYRERVMDAGEIYFPRIGAGWTVSARNGAAFEWRLGDIAVGPLSEEPGPVYAMSVDAVAAQAQDTAAPAIAGISEARPTR